MMDRASSVRIKIKERPDALCAEAALRHHAARAPGRSAFTDSPDRAEHGLGPPRAVSFAQANRITDAIAGKLRECGLKQGDALALQTPNIIETPLLILGAWRAGLVPCLMPQLWRHEEIDRAFAQVQPKAVVTIGDDGDQSPARTMCDVSARHVSIR
ncbi:MAG: AMP-binding protein, partial [Proteobacteria bacterium]|nr:AMP-binding protein [Pseudomonadota bacterium]